jgi:hypothetical protein
MTPMPGGARLSASGTGEGEKRWRARRTMPGERQCDWAARPRGGGGRKGEGRWAVGPRSEERKGERVGPAGLGCK